MSIFQMIFNQARKAGAHPQPVNWLMQQSILTPEPGALHSTQQPVLEPAMVGADSLIAAVAGNPRTASSAPAVNPSVTLIQDDEVLFIAIPKGPKLTDLLQR